MAKSFMGSLAGQTFWEIGGKLCRFLAVILIARHLGTVGFGGFALAVTFVEIMNVVADFKLDPGLVREVTQGNIPEDTAFGNAVFLKGASGVITFIISFPLFTLLNSSINALVNLACAAPALLFWQITSITRTVFQLHGILEKFTMARAVGGMFILAGSTLLISLNIYSTRAFLLVYAFSFFIEALLTLWLCSFFVSVRPIRDTHIMKKMALEGLFFTVMNAFVVFYYKIDTLLMQVFRGTEVLGLYNAAYRLLDVCMFVPVAVAAIFYPEMLRKGLYDPAGWSSGQKALDFLAGFAIPLACFIYFARSAIIEITYGPEFHKTGEYLGVLSLALIFLYLASIPCQALIVAGKEKRLMIIHASSALVSVLIYWFVIQKFGPYGAAWATVFLQATIFFAALLYLYIEGVKIDLSCVPKAMLLSAPVILTGTILDSMDIGLLWRIATLAASSVPAFSFLFIRTYRSWKDALA